MKAKLMLLVVAAFGMPAYSSNDDKIQTAVDVVESLCLSGTEYGISADLDGNITIKNFKPEGSGSVTLNAREAKGATAFQSDLRIIADQKIRECTQTQIGRILDAVLETTKQADIITPTNTTLGKAKYLGSVPGRLVLNYFVDGHELSYFRFSVKEATHIVIEVNNNSKNVQVNLVSKSEKSIMNDYYRAGEKTGRIFLIPGDYYMALRAYGKNEATAFQLVINGEPVS